MAYECIFVVMLILSRRGIYNRIYMNLKIAFICVVKVLHYFNYFNVVSSSSEYEMKKEKKEKA